METSKQTGALVQFDYETDRPVGVDIKDGSIRVKLADGRVLETPLQRHPWLEKASPEQRSNVELGVFSIDWPDLDEGLDIEWMRQESNKSSQESRHNLAQSNTVRKKRSLSCSSVRQRVGC